MHPTRIATCCGLALLWLSPASLADDFQWPKQQALAVSLSYDDALDTQLDNALPALDRHDLKASFYLTLTSPVVPDRLEEWRAAAADGHELGNHSVFHACSKAEPGMDWVADDNDLSQRTVSQMVSEIQVANAFLYSIDGEQERTFTPPCGHEQAKDGNYVDAVRDRFLGVKFAESGLPESFATLAVPSDVSGEALIEMVQAARGEHQLINIIFHGIGGDHLSVDTSAHETLLAYLADNRDTYWTDSYRNITHHLRGYYPQ